MGETKDPPISLAMARVADLAIALGAEPMNKYKGAWVYQLDDNWQIAMNGHREPVEAEPDGAMAFTLQPFECAVWWNGWLAGAFNAFGGVIAAHPDGANETTFIAAIDKKLEAVK